MKTETINKIVKAVGVSEGELILIHFWGEDSDKGVANRFVAAVAAVGATPVLLQQSRSINREIFASAKETCFGETYFASFAKFDAVLDLFAYQPVVLGYALEEKQAGLYRNYMAQLFYKLIECKRFTQIRIPTEENALESGLDPQDYIHRMELAYDIDYDSLTKECAREIERLKKVEKVSITTEEGHVLSIELTGRKWLMDAGDGDLPCGEIYIAPVENKTNGSVFFKTLYWDGEAYENVVLNIENGEVVGSNHETIAGIFAELPRENRIVCELGFGMNPNVKSLCGCTVLDEKMAGTFHIAVGANTMFGGTNDASDHIDFVGDGMVEIIA